MRTLLRKAKNFILFSETRKISNSLKKIKKEVDNLTRNIKPAQKVLFFSFSIYEPCKIHDFLFSQALRLRGAEIVPIICDKVQNCECSTYGGIWGKFNGNPENDNKQAQKNCELCTNADNILWNNLAGITPVSLNKYLSEEEKNEIDNIAETYDINNYENWTYDNILISSWIVDAIRNNYLVGNEKTVKHYQKLLKHYLINILRFFYVLKKALEDIKPDVIISNDSYYYPWSILEVLAKQNKIPFYSNYIGFRRCSYCFSMNQPAVTFDFSVPWKTWKHRELKIEEKKQIDDFLQDRCTGSAMVVNTANPSKNLNVDISKKQNINFDKPTALLASNVIWDMSALNKEIQFKDMVDWICNTINFFGQNPQWQLLVKAHPAEKIHYFPETRTLIEDEISKTISQLPDNVVFIAPESSISLYDLLPNIKMGFVYTSTAGLEMACMGIPTVTAGKSPYHNMGFTYDTNTKKEYFDTINKIFQTDFAENNTQEYIYLAKKFFYLYYFRHFASLNLLDDAFGQKTKLKVSSANDLAPGANAVLDYFCDSILSHLPIMSEDRVPPP